MKGKILEIGTTGKSWEGQHGKMWTYFVRIKNAVDEIFMGEANSKSETVEGLPYKVGKEVEFEHEPSNDIQYKDKLKIKKEGQSQYLGNKAKGNNRSFALSYAKDLAVARIGGKENTLFTTTKDIIEQADKFVEWLDR